MKPTRTVIHSSPFNRACLGLFVALACASATASAQCGKDVVLTSSNTEYLNAAGEVQRTVEEDCVITIETAKLTIAPAGKEVMTATVVSTACDWKVPFKTGKTTVQATFKDGEGSEKDATITVEGKDGKIICQMTQKDRPDRVVRVAAVKFEERKPASGK